MKNGLGFLFLLLLIGTAAVMYLASYSSKGSNDSVPGMLPLHNWNPTITAVKSRKLLGNMIDSDEDGVHLEDYRPIDPIPSSKASIRHGPIQHGTPLMPFIPRSLSPPSQHYVRFTLEGIHKYENGSINKHLLAVRQIAKRVESSHLYRAASILAQIVIHCIEMQS